MLTIKFDIVSDNPEYILDKQMKWSYAFRKLYRNFSLSGNDMFIETLRKKYDLQVREYECLIIDVKTKINQIQAQIYKLESEIISIEKEIELLKLKKKDTYNIRQLYKLTKKLPP